MSRSLAFRALDTRIVGASNPHLDHITGKHHWRRSDVLPLKRGVMKHHDLFIAPQDLNGVSTHATLLLIDQQNLILTPDLGSWHRIDIG
ncbi:hypothetical protein [Candidatus Entotheonella palauensis]|uniref:hypothetical protein n=1 Tax=Candidatus Entotheonella palauensis TaxID=93172 RepID=UPI0011774A0D|nr:hypothetical protein [Candidatus Entotheonella palauensis]